MPVQGGKARVVFTEPIKTAAGPKDDSKFEAVWIADGWVRLQDGQQLGNEERAYPPHMIRSISWDIGQDEISDTVIW